MSFPTTLSPLHTTFFLFLITTTSVISNPILDCPQYFLACNNDKGNAFKPNRQIVSPDERQRYRLIGELGRGFFGTVFEATDLNHPQHPTVAIKIEKSAVSASSSCLMMNPIKVYGKLLSHFVGSSRNNEIAALLAVGDLHAPPFVYQGHDVTAVKFKQGQTLKQVLSKRQVHRAMPLLEFQDLRNRVWDKIAALHREYNLTHADLHHENIMVINGTEISLIDFGVAGPIDSDGLSLTRKGYSKYLDHFVPETYFLAYSKRHYGKDSKMTRVLVSSTHDLFERHVAVVREKSLRVTIQSLFYAGIVAKEFPLFAEIISNYC